MKRNAKSLAGFSIGATDGEIGKLDEFYFDDETWTVRYLVVNTGNWLFGRKVLISPAALKTPDWEHKVFPVNLTKNQVEHSPDIDTERTVSRQQEIDLHSHYGWPYLGAGGAGFYGGLGMSGMIDSRVPFDESISTTTDTDKPANPHLRSTTEVNGYRIHATDGEIGDVEDFIIDDQNWRIDFLVVDTGHWFPGKKVLVSPKWITQVKWEENAVYVDITVNAVKNSPEYHPSAPLPETDQNEFHRHYGNEV